MTLNFFNGLTLLSLFITIVLSLFFLVIKKGNRTENILLSLLLIFFGFQIIYSFAVSNYAWQYFIKWHKYIYLLKQTSLLIGPFFYFYLGSFSKNGTLKFKNIIHYLPFTGAILFLFFYFLTIDNFVIWKSKIDLFVTIFILFVNLIYILLTLYDLKKVNISFRTFFRNIRSSNHITWLQLILLGFIIIWIVNLNSFAIYMIAKRPGWCAYTGSIFSLIGFLFINSIMFLLLFNPEIFYVVEKYKNNSIDQESKVTYKKKLAQYMESDKAYLNPEISLETVAKDISVNPRILSQLINESYQCNFNSYINDFRIKYCLEQLSIPDNKKTILEILFESGFNSKSVFYAEFKKQTGLTPQEFRAQCNKQVMVC
jgi:AraC-like DNA-binding protein